MNLRTLPVLFAVLSLAGPRLDAAPKPAVSETETRLREALRDTTLRLRAAEGEAQSLKSGLQTAESAAADLRRAREAGERRAAEAAKVAAERIAELTGRLDRLQQEHARVAAELSRRTEEAKRLGELAVKTEAERARLETLSRRLTVRVADREARNVKLMKVGEEILGRFEKFGLGDAIAAREPFVGAKRTELQNLAQDYADKLIEQKVTPGAPAAGEAALAPADRR